MTISQADLAIIQDKLRPLISKREKAWQPLQGIGSFLSFQFGAKLPPKPIKSKILERIRKCRTSPLPDRGEWRLWIRRCAWRVEKNGKILAGAEDTDSKIEAALNFFDSKVLTSVDIIPPFLDTVFTFENSLKLRTFSRNSKEDDHWALFTPDGNVLSLGPGSNWSYYKSSEPRPDIYKATNT